VDGPFCSSVPIATRRAVTSMVGSGTAFGMVWRCRLCARLRYSSEGGYLRPTGLGRMGRLGVMLRAYGNLPRPKSWLPCVFTSPEEAAEAGICELSSVSWYGKR